MAENLLDLSEVTLDPACAARIPPALARRRLVLPLCILEDDLHVAMANPADVQTLAAIRRETGLAAVAHAVDATELQATLLRVYGDGRPGAEEAADDAVALVDRLLRAALLRHSSDIHIEPIREGLRVRFRTDGELEEVQRIPLALQPSVISRVKVLAGLDIAERRAPQDGGFTWRATGGAAVRLPPLDVRVATLPVRHGERLTLRLLETEGHRLTLDGLGLLPADRATFGEALVRSNGLVLLTGPTGSGKTTTLYAAIRQLLAQRALNIVTVEDPVEYEIEGVSQAEVDAADKVNFAKALRSLLRHDPDVVMIGEIRDGESLDVAVKAALTGHLVLATLHTNDATSAVTRLTDMGLDPHLAAATLRLSVAQRLVRALCPHCHAAYGLSAADAAALGCPEATGETVYAPKGCLYCAGRGYRGRVGLFELFRPGPEMASRIASAASEGELALAARAAGMRTLLDDAREKCRLGITSVTEALRATGGGF